MPTLRNAYPAATGYYNSTIVVPSVSCYSKINKYVTDAEERCCWLVCDIIQFNCHFGCCLVTVVVAGKAKLSQIAEHLMCFFKVDVCARERTRKDCNQRCWGNCEAVRGEGK